MGSFGERLRREREMRGITLDEIAESTKIARRHLESLEKEDFDSLPGGIFNRGFVRSYARYLGIDEEQAVADYAAAASDPPVVENKFPLEVAEPDPELNPRRSVLPLILALLALVAVLAIFWARNRSRSSESQESGAAAASTPRPSIPSQTPLASPPVPTPQAENTPAPAAAPAPTKPGPVGSPNQSAVTVQPLVSPAGSPPPERVFSLMVTAKEDAWVTVTADGRTVISRVLNAGEQQTFRAGKRIVLTTGNAGGVDVAFNGRNLGSIGNESEVRTLTFTASGLVQ